MSDGVLSVKNLAVSLGGQQVLDRVSFNVRAGELVGLIGPNGAGKTTLMRSIMGLIRIDSGSIATSRSSLLADAKSEAKKPAVNKRSAIGYVPQRQNIDWNYPMSIQSLVACAFLGNLKAWQRPRAQHWQAVYQALQHVGLFELRERPIGELSGGQKQRVLIARALAVNPSILLLDEPFTGLDHPNQDSLSDLFRHLVSEGVSILMSTHDLSQAVDISDRLMMLNGTVRAIGTPDELRDPQLWMDTYQVRPDSALLRSLGLVMA